MKFKILVIAAVGYVAVVAAFESLLGVVQPRGDDMIVIHTTDERGTRSARVVSRLESDGVLYVAANHWPRAWYRNALENPEVSVVADGAETPYRAVPIDGAEHDRVDGEHALPIGFRVLTGFPPRKLLRLDPRS